MCVVYSTIPLFWLMIHPLAHAWRMSTRSPFRVLVPAWGLMWVGVGALPASLEESLRALDEDGTMRGWMTPLLYEAYVAVKRFEVEAAAELDIEEVCRRYASIY